MKCHSMLLSIYSNVICIIALNKVNEVHLKSSMFLFHTDIYTISCTGMFIKIESYHHIS